VWRQASLETIHAKQCAAAAPLRVLFGAHGSQHRSEAKTTFKVITANFTAARERSVDCIRKHAVHHDTV